MPHDDSKLLCTEHSARLAVVESKIDVINEKIDVFLDKLEKHDEAIRGNGKPGLIERVGLLENNRTKGAADWRVLTGLVIGSALGVAAAVKNFLMN